MLRKLVQRLRAAISTNSMQPQPLRAAILDQYVRMPPNPQSALDIFQGEWWSSLPGSWAGLKAGHLPLFDDPRIKWAIESFGGVAGKTILELGPLEGGHTYLLEQGGAQSVVAIEANSRAYVKCLIVKEVLRLQRSQFLLGDFEDYLRSSPDRYDAAIACGVIYHLRQPVEFIHNLARVTDRVYIWTQYYVQERLAQIPHMAHRFGEGHAAEHAGFRHTLHRYNYGDFLNSKGFAGGTEEFSHWLNREDLLGALRHAGFTDITIGEDDLTHTNGPCISLVASRPAG